MKTPSLQTQFITSLTFRVKMLEALSLQSRVNVEVTQLLLRHAKGGPIDLDGLEHLMEATRKHADLVGEMLDQGKRELEGYGA